MDDSRLTSIISCSRLRSASSNRYEVPRTRLKFADRDLSIAGPTAWNSLTKEITNIPTAERIRLYLHLVYNVRN